MLGDEMSSKISTEKYGAYELCFNSNDVPFALMTYFMELEYGILVDDTVQRQEISVYDRLTNEMHKYTVFIMENMDSSALVSLLKECYSYDEAYGIKIIMVCYDNLGKPIKPLIIIDSQFSYIFECTSLRYSVGIPFLVNKMKYAEGQLSFVDMSNVFIGLFIAYREYLDEFDLHYKVNLLEHWSVFGDFLGFYNLVDRTGAKTSIEVYEEKIRSYGTHKHNYEKIAADCKSMSDEFNFWSVVSNHADLCKVNLNYFFDTYWKLIPDKHLYDAYKSVKNYVIDGYDDLDEDHTIELVEKIMEVNKHDTIENPVLKTLLDTDGKLTVYIGHCWGNMNNPHSWTINKKAAKSSGYEIAKRNSRDVYSVVTGKIKLDDIIVNNVCADDGDALYGNVIVLYSNVHDEVEEEYNISD